VARQVGGVDERVVAGEREPIAAVQGVDGRGAHVQFGHTRPARIDRSSCVLYSSAVSPTDAALTRSGHVLGDERDVSALSGQV